MVINCEKIIECPILDNVKFENKTFKSIMAGFYKLGYAFYGTMYWSNKNINAMYPDVFDSLFDKIYSEEEQAYGEIKITPHYQILDVYVSSNEYNYYENAPVAISKEIGTEKVVAFKDKDKSDRLRTYYCFWNPSAKYFYFITLRKNTGYIGGFQDVRVLFQKWIELKTFGMNYIHSYYKAESEKFKKEKQEEIERLEQYKKNQLAEKSLKEEYEKIIINIENDYKKNRDNYLEIKYKDLDSDIKKDLQKASPNISYTKSWKDFMLNHEYFQIKIPCSSDVAYDTDLYVVNNKNLTDGYIYYNTYRNKYSLD